MRYDAEHKERTRERLLHETATAIRQGGPDKVGVADVMARAGLTHGGFYAHFRSREDLIEAGIGQMFKEARGWATLEGEDPRQALGDFVTFYLSPNHRDTRVSGCPLPFLAAEAPRLAEASRRRFAEGVASLEVKVAALLGRLGAQDTEATAGSVLAEMVGAVTLARAEPDAVRSDEILQRTARSVRTRLGLEVKP